MSKEDLVGTVVFHKKFDDGIVKDFDGKYMNVDFQNGKKAMKFVYPDSFESFLTIKEPEKKQKIFLDLEKRHSVIEQAYEKKLEHYEKAEAQVHQLHREVILKKKKAILAKRKKNKI